MPIFNANPLLSGQQPTAPAVADDDVGSVRQCFNARRSFMAGIFVVIAVHKLAPGVLATTSAPNQAPAGREIRKLKSRAKGKLPSTSTSQESTPKDTFALRSQV
jgi:hypothetical protein